MMEFTGKICVVTGGANGIGRCIAQNFLERDAFAAVIDTDEVRGRELAEAYPGKVLFFAGDVAEQHVLEGFADHADDLRQGGIFTDSRRLTGQETVRESGLPGKQRLSVQKRDLFQVQL